MRQECSQDVVATAHAMPATVKHRCGHAGYIQLLPILGITATDCSDGTELEA